MAYAADQIAKIRARILQDPYYLAVVLGIEIEWFHRRWFEFCDANPKHVLEAPRGFGKSTVCTTLLVIWHILRNFNIRVLLVSRTEGQASRMLQEIRGHFETNEVLKACFGEFVGTGKWTDTALVVRQRKAVAKEATVSAMGLEGQITSGHWELEIVDDPFDEESSRTPLMRDRAFEWLFTTLRPTLMRGGSIGIRCTRYHYGDLAGRIERELATEKTTGECRIYRLEDRGAVLTVPRSAAWTVLQTPAILSDGGSLWGARFPVEDRINPDGSIAEGLTRTRSEGERQFQEQYMMTCLAIVEGEEEQYFCRKWFRAWEAPPARERLHVYEFVDPAFRSAEEAARRTKRDRDPDFYAVGVVGFDRAAGRCYVLDAFRDRLTPLERETVAKRVADKWKPALVQVERTGLQTKEAPDFYARILRALAPHRARFGQPRRDKAAMSHPFARALEAGLVRWNPEVLEKYPMLVDEFARFPFADHDDFVDAVSGAYLLGERRPRSLAGFARQGQLGADGAGARGRVRAGDGSVGVRGVVSSAGGSARGAVPRT